MPRPRTVDDIEILAATARVIARLGPARLTLAAVGAEVGLAAATLVQRFGSKRDLLLALTRRGSAGHFARLREIRLRHRGAVRRLREYLLCIAELADTPDEMANHLAFLQLDLTDAGFRRHARAAFRRTEKDVKELLVDAVEGDELRACDPARLAPVLVAVVQGALLAWAVEQRGAARRRVARRIDTVLAPYLGD